MKNIRIHKIYAQAGAALFVSLIFLLILTIIAVTAMNSTILDTKVVTNQKEKEMAVRLADVVMREPEVWLQDQNNKVKYFINDNNRCSGDPSAECITSQEAPLWKTINLSYWNKSAINGWWGDVSSSSWTGSPVVYGVNGSAVYCSGKTNEVTYTSAPSYIDDGNSYNNCLTNTAIPPTYVVEEIKGGSTGGGGSSVRDASAQIGIDSTCKLKKDDYFWQITIQSAGRSKTNKSMIRGVYVKKC